MIFSCLKEDSVKKEVVFEPPKKLFDCAFCQNKFVHKFIRKRHERKCVKSKKECRRERHPYQDTCSEWSVSTGTSGGHTDAVSFVTGISLEKSLSEMDMPSDHEMTSEETENTLLKTPTKDHFMYYIIAKPTFCQKITQPILISILEFEFWQKVGFTMIW